MGYNFVVFAVVKLLEGEYVGTVGLAEEASRLSRLYKMCF